MAERQNQKTGSGGTSVQAAGDVNFGYGADDVAKIIDAVSRIIPERAAEAEQRAERRFEEFKERLIKEIFQAKNGNPDAFSDPDFIYILKKGQENYGRTSSEFNHATLVDLVAQRSSASSGSRKSYILNEAIEQAGKLSSSEVGLLCLLFTTNNIAIESIVRVGDIVIKMPWIEDCVQNIDDLDSTIEYLQSLGLLSVVPLPNKLDDRINLNYPTIKIQPREYREVKSFSNGVGEAIFIVVKDQYQSFVGDISKSDIDSLMVVPLARNEQSFIERCSSRLIDSESSKKMYNSFQIMPEDPLDWLKKNNTPFERMSKLYSSGLMNVALTAPAKAIAHAYLSGRHAFNASIDIWVK